MWDATRKLIFDGDSHMAYISNMPTLRAPISTNSVQFVNIGISGQTWRQMTGLDGGSIADLQSALSGASGGYTLVCLEGTNSMVNPGVTNPFRTPSQALQDAADYISAAKATGKISKVVVVGCPYCCGTATSQTQRDQFNQNIKAYSDALRANPGIVGADRFVDLIGPGKRLYMSSWTIADFDAMPGVWREASGSQIHLTDAEYGRIADDISATLLTL